LSEDVRKSVLPQGNHLVDTRRDTFALMIDPSGRIVTAFNVSGWRAMNQRSMQDLVERRYNWAWPQLTGTKWEYYWSGSIDLRADLFPRLFEIAPGLVTAIGFSGRGIPTGTAMGTVLADFLSGTPKDELAAPIEAPSYVPPMKQLVARMMVPRYRRQDARAMRNDGLVPPRF
jgi:glycine/D-amino acid oxidase-like deaminating enzyme